MFKKNKKLIISIVLVIIFSTPLLVRAQTVSDIASLLAPLTRLVSLLSQQVVEISKNSYLAAVSLTSGVSGVPISDMIVGRQTYASQQVMWKDTQGVIHIISAFGGADARGDEPAHLHYINTGTGASALVQGGACAFGRAGKVVYSPVHNKVYWGGEYCNRVLGGSFNEFDPVTMTNKVLQTGVGKWYGTMTISIGDDNRIYFVAMDSDGLGSHLYSYDPAVGISSWKDYGVIYGRSNGISPGLAIDTSHIYVAWQDNTSNGYWHLMVHPIGEGSWSEIHFGDGLYPTGYNLRILKERTTKKLFVRRTVSTGTTSHWLQNGATVPVLGSAPVTGAQAEMDVNMRNIIVTGAGDYNMFIQAFQYEMNWDRVIPDPARPISVVSYGSRSTWQYPTSGFQTSALSYNGPWYAMKVDAVVPATGTNVYAVGPSVTRYEYMSRVGIPVGALPSVSVYHALRVPAPFSPLGTDEVYVAGYANRVFRWNPTLPTSNQNPIIVTPGQHMNYRVFMDYDSAGKVWVGGNFCGATAGCVDFGSVAWYDPSNGTSGDMFSGVWTGGNPPATGNGIKFTNFAMSNNRTKLVVSSNDGKLTVINALTKSIEGVYNLGTKAFLVEVVDDQVLGVTTSSNTGDARVFLFRPSDRTMIKNLQQTGVVGYMFGSQDGSRARMNFKLERGADGYAWLFVDKKIYRIHPTTLVFEYVATDTSDSNKMKWAPNGQDLIVYGGLRPAYFPSLLKSVSTQPLPESVQPQSTSYTVSVVKSGTGSGSVSSSLISCGSVCTQTVSGGTNVTFTANPSTGSVFSGWSGGGCSNSSTCNVTINTNTQLTAQFDTVQTSSLPSGVISNPSEPLYMPPGVIQSTENVVSYVSPGGVVGVPESNTVYIVIPNIIPGGLNGTGTVPTGTNQPFVPVGSLVVGSDTAVAVPLGVIVSNSSVAFTRPLYQGVSGEEVSALQRILIQEGLLPIGSATGYYGPMTTKAVGEYQKRYGIVSSGTPATTGFGLVGAKTRAMLNQRQQGFAYNTTTTTIANDASIKALEDQIVQLTALVNELIRQLSIVLSSTPQR